jgi:hypothetical protein
VWQGFRWSNKINDGLCLPLNAKCIIYHHFHWIIFPSSLSFAPG